MRINSNCVYESTLMSLIRTVCETTSMYANRPRSCRRNDLDVCESTCMRNDRHPEKDTIWPTQISFTFVRLFFCHAPLTSCTVGLYTGSYNFLYFLTYRTLSLVLAVETNFVSRSVTREIALVFCLFYLDLASVLRHNEQHKERQ